MIKALKDLSQVDQALAESIHRSIQRRNLIIVVLMIGLLSLVGGFAYQAYVTTDLEDVMAYFIDWRVVDDRMDEVLHLQPGALYYDYNKDIKNLSDKNKLYLYATQLIFNDLNTVLPGMLKDYNYVESLESYNTYNDYIDDYDAIDIEVVDDVVYMGLYTFEKDFLPEVRAHAQAINEASALVIDLRNNPGGYISYALDFIDLFVEKDKRILSDVAYGMEDETYSLDDYTQTGVSLKPKKIYLLVDAGTASSAEIVTYALNAHVDTVEIIGQTTYGKGVSTLTFDKYYGATVTLLASYFSMENGDGTTTAYQSIGIEPEVAYLWSETSYSLSPKDLIALVKDQILNK